MDSDFWHERWRQNQIGFHQQEINAHLQAFWPDLKLPAGSRVFVPLCGKSRDLLWLRAQEQEVLGVEVSPIAVRDFFDENQLQPEILLKEQYERWEEDKLVILCCDFFELDAEDLKDISAVYDRASLVALPLEMRARYARHLAQILPPTAQLLLVSMEYEQEEMQGPPFSVHEDEIQELFGSNFQISRLYSHDMLKENPALQKKGLTQMIEKVYKLEALT